MQRITEVNEIEILETMQAADIQTVAIASGTSKDNITSIQIDSNALGGDKSEKKQEVFGAASLSKPVFAYLVLKLINDRDFKLDSKLNDILPFGDFCAKNGWDNSEENRKRAMHFTPAMILSHKTGLPIGYDPGLDKENPNPLKFDFEPDKAYGYSGLHLMYLQECIQIKFGKKLENLAKELVFEPAGMSSSTTFNSSNGQNAANSLHTTAEDYARFCIHWMQDPDPRVQDAFNSKVSLRDDPWAVREDISKNTLDHLSWGYGWCIEKTDSGNRIASHTGDMNQYRTGVELDLDTKSVRVFFSKSSSQNGHVLRDQIFGKSHTSDYFFDKYKFARTVDELQEDWRLNPHYGERKKSIKHSNTMSVPPVSQQDTMQLTTSTSTISERFRVSPDKLVPPTSVKKIVEKERKEEPNLQQQAQVAPEPTDDKKPKKMTPFGTELKKK